jgi:hypothetical protein
MVSDYVCTVGCIVFYVCLILGVIIFDRRYYIIYRYCYLILDLFAKIFINVLLYVSAFPDLVLVGVRAYCNYTYRVSISSADSFISASGARSCSVKVGYLVATSFPLAVVGA